MIQLVVRRVWHTRQSRLDLRASRTNNRIFHKSHQCSGNGTLCYGTCLPSTHLYRRTRRHKLYHPASARLPDTTLMIHHTFQPYRTARRTRGTPCPPTRWNMSRQRNTHPLRNTARLLVIYNCFRCNTDRRPSCNRCPSNRTPLRVRQCRYRTPTRFLLTDTCGRRFCCCIPPSYNRSSRTVRRIQHTPP